MWANRYVISRPSIVVVGSVRYENHDGTKRAGPVMMRRGISIWVCNVLRADVRLPQMPTDNG
jgi:hypothetical protein